MIRKCLPPSALVGLLVGTLAFVGCNKSETASTDDAAALAYQSSSTVTPVAASAPTSVEGEEEHAHVAGAHGGIIVSLGRDSYHVEAVFEKGGLLHLYMLGSDESKVQEVDAQELTAYVKASDSNESV